MVYTFSTLLCIPVLCKLVFMTRTDRFTPRLDHSWIIARFGGVRPLAEALGHAHPTTVQAWKRRKIIPVRQIPAVIAAAAARGLTLTPEDFFGPESER